MGKKLDLIGDVFGSLTVLARGEQDQYGRYKWLCQCKCGVVKQIHGRHLVNGRTKSCGCKVGIELPKPALGLTGDKHPKWKGGVHYQDGYKRVWVAPYTYEFEHRLNYGSTVPEGFVVHHEDGNKLNNVAQNLALLSRSAHAKEHGLGKQIRRRKRVKR